MKKGSIACIVLVILMIVTGTYISLKKNSLSDQRAAQRWSDEQKMVQLSIIYPLERSEYLDDMYFDEAVHNLQSNIEKSAIADSVGITDENGISFPYSVSVAGGVMIENGNKSVTTAALGVKESFFVFHPVALMYGSYFSGRDLMDDGIIIDDEIAWNLFGSSDVVGKPVNIGGVPHYIKGVVSKEDDRFAKAAGLDKPICYMSMGSMKKYGTITGNYMLELVLPDPVENFASELVKTSYGSELEDDILIDNTHRFEMKKCLNNLFDFGIRSMSTKGVMYPYYENIARAWEDIFGVLYLLQCLYTIVILIILFDKYINFRRTTVYKKIRKALKLQLPWRWKIWGILSETKRRRKNEKKN